MRKCVEKRERETGTDKKRQPQTGREIGREGERERDGENVLKVK